MPEPEGDNLVKFQARVRYGTYAEVEVEAESRDEAWEMLHTDGAIDGLLTEEQFNEQVLANLQELGVEIDE